VKAIEVILFVVSPLQPQVVDYKWLWRENLGSDSGKWIPYDESQNGKLEAEWKKKNQQVKANFIVGCHPFVFYTVFVSLVVHSRSFSAVTGTKINVSRRMDSSSPTQ
jgi:hypothetical protein